LKGIRDNAEFTSWIDSLNTLVFDSSEAIHDERITLTLEDGT